MKTLKPKLKAITSGTGSILLIIMLVMTNSCVIRIPTVELSADSDSSRPRIDMHVLNYDMREAYDDTGAEEDRMISGSNANFVVPSLSTPITFLADTYDRESGVRISTMTFALTYRCTGSSTPVNTSVVVSTPNFDPGPAEVGDEVNCDRVTAHNIRLSEFDALCSGEDLGNIQSLRGTITVTALNYKGLTTTQDYSFKVELDQDMM